MNRYCGWNASEKAASWNSIFFSRLYFGTYHLGCYFNRHRSQKTKNITGYTLLLYLSDLFHSFLQDCTFVRLDIEVVDVVEVGKDQLGELFDVFVLVLAVALLVAPLWATETKTTLGWEDGNSRRDLKKHGKVWVNACMVILPQLQNERAVRKNLKRRRKEDIITHSFGHDWRALSFS